jgi:hypothetical protein
VEMIGKVTNRVNSNKSRNEIVKTEPVIAEKIEICWDSIIKRQQDPVLIADNSISKAVIKTECDRIYLANGKMILGTFIQMTDNLFTYKNCGGNSTAIESIELKKLKFIVREKGDTIFPMVEAERWKQEHGVDEKKKGDIERVKKNKKAAVILFSIFGPILLAGGIALLAWGITWGGAAYVGFFSLLIGIFGGGFLILGGIAFIILAIVTGLRN